MKTIKLTLLIAVMVLFVPKTMNAQQMFHVHEDVVKPSMTMEYETVLAEVGKLIKEYPLENTTMLVLQGDNNSYYFVRPISSMADLDNPSPVSQLATKAGGDKVWPLFERMDKCYDIEKDYIITLDNELSYMPNGMTQTPEGENYREQYKIYFSPENRGAVKESMKAIKDMFVAKGSKMHYRVYKSGFGTESEFYLVSIAAKDELDMATKGKANQDLMGEAGQQTMFSMFQKVRSMENIEGMMRPDIGINQN